MSALLTYRFTRELSWSENQDLEVMVGRHSEWRVLKVEDRVIGCLAEPELVDTLCHYHPLLLGYVMVVEPGADQAT
jgi:hypothetical protein